MKPSFIPYSRQWLDQRDIDAVINVLKSDFLTQGPEIAKFEQALCQYTGAKYCVAVANGTAALHIAVAVLEIEQGKEGLTSANTFLASANCLVYNRLKPVFADIDPTTYCVDTDEIEKRTTKNTKVFVPVDFAGQPAEMEEIYRFAKSKDIYVVEDACHAIGSKYQGGSRVGSCKYADMTVFSFHPVKTITSGEGGAITTNDKKLYEKLLILRNHGMVRDKDKLFDKKQASSWYYEMQTLGFNYRITDIQAALGTSQLKKLDRFAARRREIVKLYNQAFSEIDGLTPPFEAAGVYSVFHLYVLKIDFAKFGISRQEVMEKLKKGGIGTQVHYIPVHTQPYYQKNFGCKWGDYPKAEQYYREAMSMPLYPKMTDSNVRYVVKKVFEVLEL